MGKGNNNPCGKGILWRQANIWRGKDQDSVVATFQDVKIVYYDKVLLGIEVDGYLTYFPVSDIYVEVL